LGAEVDSSGLLVQVAIALLFGAVLPWAAVRLSLPALERSERASVRNYAGRTVVFGLGIGWFIWGLGAAFAATLPFENTLAPMLLPAGTVGLLAVAAFGLGLFDDAYGTGESKGFRGHIRSALKGALSTGGLKLLGISAASLTVAITLTDHAPWLSTLGEGSLLARAGVALLAGAAIALTSNLVNLTDLRPGRAQKVYLMMVAIGFVAALTRAMGAAPGSIGDALVAAGIDALWVLGPLAATLRPDLRGRGMLGDAGANAMGAVAGVYVAYQLGIASLCIWLVLVLVLNLVSERVSFTAVIARHQLLTRLDNLGRLNSGDDHPNSRENYSDYGD